MHYKSNMGFGGRIFLFEDEWNTFTRRSPVRFVRRKKALVCAYFGKEAAESNPFQNAHIIGFIMGVLQLGLTPDFLDAPENIKTAHKKLCNDRVELSLEQSMQKLRNEGVVRLPEYLPKEIHNLWRQLCGCN